MNSFSPACLTALAVIANGEVFEEPWHDEGDASSGPSGGTTFGYRHGPNVLELTRDGSVILYVGEDGMVIYDSAGYKKIESYVGVRAMIHDHLAAVERNARRNGLQFVVAGQRPAEGEYSLNEILRRERAIRGRAGEPSDVQTWNPEARI